MYPEAVTYANVYVIEVRGFTIVYTEDILGNFYSILSGGKP